jgi:hypothetical protein
MASQNLKIKSLENCLKLFYKCKEILIAIILKNNNNLNEPDDDAFQNEANKLTKIFIQRIQFTLKNLIKLLTNKKK